MKIIMLVLTLIFCMGCARNIATNKIISEIDDARHVSALYKEIDDTPQKLDEKARVLKVLDESKNKIESDQNKINSLNQKLKAESKFTKLGKWVVGIVTGIVLFFVIVFVVKLYIRIQTGGLVK